MHVLATILHRLCVYVYVCMCVRVCVCVWRIAVNEDGRRVEVGFGRRLSLWCHSGGHCLLESSVDSSVVLRGEAEGGEVHLLCFPLNFVGST